jgi:hypothetical protein
MSLRGRLGPRLHHRRRPSTTNLRWSNGISRRPFVNGLLCRSQLVLQASSFDCRAFDPFSLHEDFLAASEVDVGGREIFQALVMRSPSPFAGSAEMYDEPLSESSGGR